MTDQVGDDTAPPKSKDDVAQIFAKLSNLPIANQHPSLLSQCRPIIQLWHDTFSIANPPLWNRMRRALPKELNESAFIIDEMMKFFDTNVDDSRPPYTIVDMSAEWDFFRCSLVICFLRTNARECGPSIHCSS